MTTFELFVVMCLIPIGAVAWTALILGAFLAFAYLVERNKS